MHVRSLNKLYANVRSGAQNEKTTMNDSDHLHWLTHIRVGRSVHIERECHIRISVNHDVCQSISLAGPSGKAFRARALLRRMGSNSTSKMKLLSFVGPIIGLFR
jgi:hypothetical protein